MRHLIPFVILITLAFGFRDGEAKSIGVYYDCAKDYQEKTPPQSSLFRPLNTQEQGLLFRQYRECPLWLKVDLFSGQQELYSLQIQYPTMDWAQLWIDGVPSDALGSALPMSKRKVATHLPAWVFPLDSGNHSILLHVNDTTGQRNVPFFVAPLPAWLRHLEKEAFLNGILIGLLLLNVFVAFVLAILVGRKMDSWFYAIFVLFTTTYLLVASGHAFPILWPEHPEVNGFIQFQSALFASACLVLWILRFQDAARYSPRWTRVNGIIAVAVIIPALFLPLYRTPGISQVIQTIRQLGILDSLTMALLSSTLLHTIWLAWKKGRRESWALLASLLIPVLTMIISYAHDLGLVSLPIPNRLHLLQIAAVLLFTVFSGALAFSLKRRLEGTTELEHRFSTTVVQAADRERERIARELHDDIGQRLVALQYQLYNEGTPKPAAEIRDILKDLRQLAHGLHPALLINGQLGEALEIWARDLESKGICKIQILMDEDTRKIRGEYALHLLRIFQECMSNALRHGQATEMQIEGSVENAMTRFQVKNNGIPMALETVEGLGFTSIRARLRLMGGALEISNSPEGTSGPILKLQFPN